MPQVFTWKIWIFTIMVMRRVVGSMWLLIFSLVLLVSLLCGSALLSGRGTGNKNKIGDKKEFPLIACSTCTSLSYVLYDFASQMHAEVSAENDRAVLKKTRSSKKRLDETLLSEVLEGVCDPESVHGEWLRHLDIVEVSADVPSDSGNVDSGVAGKEYRKLVTKFHEFPGRCGTECRTLARSCELLLQEELDIDELQTFLYRYHFAGSIESVGHDEINKLMCLKMTRRCNLQKTFVSGTYIRKNEVFEEVTEKDIEMERLMAQMQEAGMGDVSAYGRDDLDALAHQMADGYDDSESEYYGEDEF